MSRDLDDSLLTVKEAAEVLKVHPETVRAWLRDGMLAGVKPGAGGRGGRWRVPKLALENMASVTATSPLPAVSPKEARRG